MKKIVLTAVISLFFAWGACAYPLAPVKTMITEKTQSHKSIFEIPVLVVLPQRASLIKTATGAADKQAKITLDASVLYTPINMLMTEFSESKLKERGLELKSSTEFIWNGSRAILMKIFQPLEDEKVKGQWVFIIDRKDHTWMLNGAYDARNQDSSAEIIKILQSAWWDPGNGATMTSASQSGPDVSGTPFKLAKVSSGALIYTKDGKLPTQSKDRAIFVATKIQNLHVTANRQTAFAKEKCVDAALGNELAIISENTSVIKGKNVTEIVATADSEEEETLVYQTMLFGGGDYNVMVGIAHADNDSNIAYFKKLSESCLSRMNF